MNAVIALLQRVSEASVIVNDSDGHPRVIGAIGQGILGLIGVERHDEQPQADRLLERILAYRLFDDEAGKMNLNLRQVNGELLLVSQFTLAANTNKGNRASFTSAAAPEDGRQMFNYLVQKARQQLNACATGEFGAHMRVQLVNDGPVTFWLQVPPTTPET